MKKNNLIIVIGVLSVIILIGVVSLYYFYNNMKSVGIHISDLTAKSANAARAEQEIKNLNTSASLLKPQIDKIDSYFIGSDGEVDFINQVEDLARENGLKINIDSVSNITSDELTKSGLQYLNLKMTVTGGWSGNYKLLYEMENLPYRVDINQVDMLNVTDKGVSTSVVWQGKLDINVLQKI